jgi:transcriptional regulator with XRE-family HTH domain
MAPRHSLRQRREQQGLTQESAAFDLRVAVSTYRSWERGEKTPRVGYRPRLAKLLGVTLAEIDRYLDGTGVPTPNGHVVPTWLGYYASLEQGAGAIDTFEPIVVPGLLQTREYATAVARASHVPGADHEVAEWVGARLARQQVLDRDPDPLRLRAVLDDSVLRRLTGAPGVMAEQLGHLAEMSRRPNVSIRILPFDGRIHCAAWGAFRLITAPGAAVAFMACAEDLGGVRYHETPHTVDAHIGLFEHLWAAALPPGASRDLVAALSREVRDEAVVSGR